MVARLPWVITRESDITPPIPVHRVPIVLSYVGLLRSALTLWIKNPQYFTIGYLFSGLHTYLQRQKQAHTFDCVSLFNGSVAPLMPTPQLSVVSWVRWGEHLTHCGILGEHLRWSWWPTLLGEQLRPAFPWDLEGNLHHWCVLWVVGPVFLLRAWRCLVPVLCQMRLGVGTVNHTACRGVGMCECTWFDFTNRILLTNCYVILNFKSVCHTMYFPGPFLSHDTLCYHVIFDIPLSTQSDATSVFYFTAFCLSSPVFAFILCTEVSLHFIYLYSYTNLTL